MKQTLKLPTAVLAAASLAACVTINIYFPAAAAEKAADKIIDEVWQLQKDQAKPAGTTTTSPAAPAIPASTPTK